MAYFGCLEMGLIKVIFEVTESFRNLENIKAEAKAEKRGRQNAYSSTLTTPASLAGLQRIKWKLKKH